MRGGKREGAGRKKSPASADKTISIRLSAEELEALDRKAEAEGLSRNQIIRNMLKAL